MYSRPITLAFTLIILGLVLPLPATGQGKDKPDLTVRKLTVKADPKGLPSGGTSVTVFTSQKEAAKVVGEGVAKQLADQVDFTKEQVAHVQWTTGGPPFGVLQHEVKKTGDAQEVVFYIQGPPAGAARGRALRLGNDYFAIPPKIKATLDPKERPGK
jgi:hypothetical protein